GEVLRVRRQRLRGQRTGEREPKEPRGGTVLVDREAVRALRLPGPAEHHRGVRRAVGGEERAAGLLVEGRQEVRYRAGQPLAERDEPVVRRADAGPGGPRQPL